MSRRGLTTLLPLLSKAKVCGDFWWHQFLSLSPTGKARVRRGVFSAVGVSCHSSAPSEASYVWLGQGWER